jgi:hypothetical protein
VISIYFIDAFLVLQERLQTCPQILQFAQSVRSDHSASLNLHRVFYAQKEDLQLMLVNQMSA